MATELIKIQEKSRGKNTHNSCLWYYWFLTKFLDTSQKSTEAIHGHRDDRKTLQSTQQPTSRQHRHQVLSDSYKAFISPLWGCPYAVGLGFFFLLLSFSVLNSIWYLQFNSLRMQKSALRWSDALTPGRSQQLPLVLPQHGVRLESLW